MGSPTDLFTVEQPVAKGVRPETVRAELRPPAGRDERFRFAEQVTAAPEKTVESTMSSA
jgi:hypothetical protein